MVQTVNGKITEGDNSKVYKWTSLEDKKHFEEQIAKHNLIVMGSSTYEAAKKVIKPEPGKLRVVLTRDPARYKSEEIIGQLEFLTASAEQVVQQCESRGFTQMLLAGGGQINRLFFNAGLVNELYLTVEPKIFAEGKSIVDEQVEMVDLQLLEVNRLNEAGTILLHYQILPRVPQNNTQTQSAV